MAKEKKEGLLKQRIHEAAEKGASEIESRFLGGAVRVSLKTVDQIVDEAKSDIFFHLEKEDKVGLYFALKKWFGEEKKNGH